MSTQRNVWLRHPLPGSPIFISESVGAGQDTGTTLTTSAKERVCFSSAAFISSSHPGCECVETRADAHI